MTSILVAVVALAIAVAIQRLVLAPRGRVLRAHEQAFRFHTIRDELQTLALKGVVRQDDPVYSFVMWTTNLCIRNAGVIRLRDTLSTARTVDSKVQGESFNRFLRDVKRKPEPLQQLVGQTFIALAEMLVANDHLVRAGLKGAIIAANAWKLLQPALRWFVEAADHVAELLAPTRAQAVVYARKYHNLGGRLAAA